MMTIISSAKIGRRLKIAWLRPAVTDRSISTVEPPSSSLLQYYTVTPPIKPWPQRLYTKRLVSMISRQQNLDLALQIFLHAGKYHPGFFHNYDTYNAIIVKLSRARAFEPMEALLAQLQSTEPKIKCGENLFIDVLRNYGLAGRPKLALKTFLRIPDFGVQRSVRSLNTLLNSLVQNKRYDLVHAMFKSSKEKFGVLPNVYTCNILIKALVKKNDIEGALKVFDEMPATGMVPNVVTYTTILSGYVARGDMESAKRVFGELFDRGWFPDATTYTVLIYGYCKLGEISNAVKLMDEMEENGVEPNDVTYGVMIESFCKEEKSGEARNLFDDMLDRKYIPSPALCCKVIDALCEDGKVDEACGMWRKMLKKNCVPDNAILSTLIHWLCKGGSVWEARKLFAEFEKGTIPTLLTYNTLIAGMCEKGELSEAGRLWDDMVEKQCKPNAYTYEMLIKGFSQIGNASESLKLFEEMLEKGHVPNKNTYSVLMDHCNEFQEAEFDRVLSTVVSKGMADKEFWDISVTKMAREMKNPLRILDRLLLEDKES